MDASKLRSNTYQAPGVKGTQGSREEELAVAAHVAV